MTSSFIIMRLIWKQLLWVGWNIGPVYLMFSKVLYLTHSRELSTWKTVLIIWERESTLAMFSLFVRQVNKPQNALYFGKQTNHGYVLLICRDANKL